MTRKPAPEPEILSDLAPAGVPAPAQVPEPETHALENKAPEIVGDLAPELVVPAASRQYWYHVGMRRIEGVGTVALHVAGLCFQVETESIYRKSWGEGGSMGAVDRVKRRGTLVPVTRAQLELLAVRVRRTVVRPSKAGVLDEDTLRRGEILDPYAHRRPSPKTLFVKLDVPSEEEQKQLDRARNRRSKRYVPRDGDLPISAVVYCVPCLKNEPLRMRSFDDPEPQPLSATGLRLPDSDCWEYAEGQLPAGSGDLHVPLEPPAAARPRGLKG